MARTSDAVIIGAGISGLATAYHLGRRGLKALVLERDHAGAGSTSRCIGGIRQQFSTEAAIRLMQEAVAQFRGMEREFGFPVDYRESGYLFLAHDPKRLELFRSILPLQRRLGLPVEILSADDCRRLVPGLDPLDLLGGAYSPADGQACPFRVLRGYVQELRRCGARLQTGTAVTAIDTAGGAVRGVRTAAGETVSTPLVVDAAGPWAAEVAALAGVDLPVRPEEHEAFITDRQPPRVGPMLVDYRSDGCYFTQRRNGQVIGCYTPQAPRPGTDTRSSPEFLVQMSRRTRRLVPALANARVVRHWGGSYENTPDLSPIIDRTPLAGFYAAAGMSGHGFMFGPAVGRSLAGIILDGAYPFDWSEFSYGRNFSRAELMK